MAKRAKYLIPDESGYTEVHFETDTGATVEVPNKRYVSDAQKDFLNKNLNNILTKESVVNDFTTRDPSRPASANSVNKLYELLGGVKIVISDSQPERVPGRTIIWIDSRKSEE